MARPKAWWKGRLGFHIKKQALSDLHDSIKKTLVRPDIDPIFQGIRVGQILVLRSGDLCWPFRVLAVRRYPDLEVLMRDEDLYNIFHGDSIQATDYLATVLEKYLDKPMLAIDLEPISKEEAGHEKRG